MNGLIRRENSVVVNNLVRQSGLVTESKPVIVSGPFAHYSVLLVQAYRAYNTRLRVD